ncbi:competence type IV pilus major pilin ComGC [Alteribacter populi]|uniref:competence type IV pilus major pilin ComGC n=1 Tax=Alteribacter populi TaxID=2011011 RepID=UPI0018E2127D|nr:competence type IV pilus major pilin ComGC [Alteribacter populi]
MKGFLKEEKGFTLIEMVIVLMIISVLLLIAVPSLTKNTEVANKKGCEATVEMVQAQVASYEVSTSEKLTDLATLESEGYVDRIKCPDNRSLTLTDGVVGVED